MTSAPTGHRHNGSDPHAPRRIPIRVHHADEQRAQQREDSQRTKADTEPLPTHAEKHIPYGVAGNTEINRRDCQQPDKIVGRTKFGTVSRALFEPPNTAASIAAQIGVSVRTVERWMTGEPFDPPTKLVVLVLQETFGK